MWSVKVALWSSYTRRNLSWLTKHSSSSQQALSAALCGSLCPSTRAHFEPTHCVWVGNVGSTARHRLLPARSHPTTHAVPILLCLSLHMTVLWRVSSCEPSLQLIDRTWAAQHRRVAEAELYFKAKGQRQTPLADHFFSLRELGQQQEEEHVVLNQQFLKLSQTLRNHSWKNKDIKLTPAWAPSHWRNPFLASRNGEWLCFCPLLFLLRVWFLSYCQR